MNYSWIIITFILFFPFFTNAQVTLYSQDFEGPDFDTYTLFDGMPTAVPFNQSSDNYIVRAAPNSVPVGNTIAGFTGNVIAIEDTDDAGFFGEPFIRTNSFSIVGYTDISIQIKFAAGSGADGSIYETSDFIDVDYRINGIGAWNQAHRLEGSASGKFWYDSDNDGVTETGDDININQNAQLLEKSFSVSGSTMELRITMGSWGDDEEMMFDDIMVEAIVPCTPAVITSLNASTNDICFGDTSTISVLGSLNDALVWFLYEDGCGTIPVTSNSLGIFNVSPTNNTTYYLRGEDGTGCINEATQSCNSISINVNPLPSVNVTSPPSLCFNTEINTNLSGGIPIGGIYSGPGCIDDGNGSSYSLDPNIAGIGNHIINYSYTDGNGCSSGAQGGFTIHDLPTVSIATPGNFCDNILSQTGLSGGSPIGGVFSGLGVTDDNNGLTYGFDPGISGFGLHLINYQYADSNGCIMLDSVTIEVFSAPLVNGNGFYSYCMDSSELIIIGGAVPYGGIYSGMSIVDNADGLSYTCNTIAAGPGIHEVNYNYADSNGCSVSIADTLQLLDLPSVFAGSDQTLCNGDSTLLQGTGAFYYVWDNSVINGIPFSPPLGSSTYILTGTDSNGCFNNDVVSITVNPLPTNTVTQIGSTLTANNVNALYQWINCDSLMLSISGATLQIFEPNLNGAYAVILNENGCIDTSDCITVSTLSLRSQNQALDFLAFPNPGNGLLNLQFSQVVHGFLKIYNAQGSVVYTAKLNSNNWYKDLSFLNSGFYVIEVSKNEVFCKKSMFIY